MNENKNAIKFIIDNQKFTITLFFSEGDLTKTIREGFKRNMKGKEISKTMTNNMIYVVAEALNRVAEITGIDLKLYSPIIKMEE